MRWSETVTSSEHHSFEGHLNIRHYIHLLVISCKTRDNEFEDKFNEAMKKGLSSLILYSHSISSILISSP